MQIYDLLPQSIRRAISDLPVDFQGLVEATGHAYFVLGHTEAHILSRLKHLKDHGL